MRVVLALLLAALLSGCESASERAVKMEMQDDAACQQLSAGKGSDAYTACRRNLMVYREQVSREDEAGRQRAMAIGQGLQSAGASLCSIGSPESARAAGCR
jgi:hypothetical protein